MKKIFLLIFLILSVLYSNAQIPSYIPIDSLMVWYPFNGNTNDESGNGNHGVSSGLILDTDRFGNPNSAYYFDSLAQMFASYGQPNSVLTISMWTKEQYTPNGQLSLDDINCQYQSPWFFNIYSFSYNPQFPTQGYETVMNIAAQGSSYPFGYSRTTDWQHHVYIYDGDSASLYVNGVLFYKEPYYSGGAGTEMNPGPSVALSSAITFGYSGGQFFTSPYYCYVPGGRYGFMGRMDDIGIWNRVLTEQEITALYLSTSCTVPSYVPTNGLVGYWPFCGNANDVSGNGHNGISMGASLTTDRFGDLNSAYDFNGSTNYIDCGDSSVFELNDFTLSAWVNKNSLGLHNNIVTKSTGAVGEIGYRLLTDPPSELPTVVWSRMGVPQAGSGYAASPDSISNNAWYHILATKESDSMKIYVNGIQKGSVGGMTLPFNNNNPLLIGGAYYNGSITAHFNGKIDDVAIWDRALTDTEISQLYTLSCAKPDFVSLGTERTTTLCPNDSVKIFVVNPQGPGLTYQWYKSDAVIPGAVDSFYYANEVRKYKVRVSNGPNCFRTSGRIQPTVAIPPTVSITPQGSTDICAGDSVLLVANYVPGYTYQWRRYGVDIPGATDTMYYASQPGNYKIFITNDGGCISKSSNVSVNIVCRLAGSSVANDVEVMPNPTSDNFSVKLNDLGEEVPVSVEFIDQQGRLIESRRVNGQTLIDFTAMGLSNGNYTVIVRFESGETVEKVVSVVR